MAEFFLEILSEEIPARMQEDAVANLKRLVREGLEDWYVPCDPNDVRVFSTPRRLTILIENLDSVGYDWTEEVKGPRVNAPQYAIDGFCQSHGLTKEELSIDEDKKGKFYVAKLEHEGRDVVEILDIILPNIITSFPWPKSMLWGEGDLRWARPLHSILALFDGEPVVFEAGGIKSGNTTFGISNDKPIKINNFDDYFDKLDGMGIILDHKDRFGHIEHFVYEICNRPGLYIIEDDGLLDEITGLVEAPVCILGRIGEDFLDLPEEVLRTSMKTHQKFLSVRSINGQITHFVTVANKNNATDDVIDTIRKGNERVLSARLADAKFFWENDLRIAKEGMKPWIAGLEKMTFHNKLGTQAGRVARIASFAKTHADLFGVDSKKAQTAARLMKLDLCSDMVGEFPELQGIMGAHYTKHAGHFGDIPLACKEHYKPLGLKDETPENSLSIALAIADKLDSLAGFWAIGQTPTSSKDPFALRRAALGVIRLILDNELRVSLLILLKTAFKPFIKPEPDAEINLLAFFQDRIKIYLREKESIQPDTIDSCLFGESPDDLTFLYNRAKALEDFRQTPECENLLQGFKRAHNILTAEQKKDGVFYEMPPEEQYFQDPTEGTLFKALEAAEKELPKLLEAEKFPEMLKTLAKLRTPIDTFFEAVQVNSEVEIVRRNRLCLLHKICSTMKTFADFSLLNG